MAMSLIWTVMVGAAVLCGLATGNGPAVAKGARVEVFFPKARFPEK